MWLPENNQTHEYAHVHMHENRILNKNNEIRSIQNEMRNQ